jgi:hypothetical protein
MEPAHPGEADRELGEVSVGEELEEAGWEVRNPGRDRVELVSAQIVAQTYHTRLGCPAIT